MDLFEPRNTIGTSTATICHWGSWCFMIGEIEWAYGNNVEHRQHHWGTTLVKSPNGDCRSRHMPCEAVTLWVFGRTKNAKSRGFTPSPPCFFLNSEKVAFWQANAARTVPYIVTRSRGEFRGDGLAMARHGPDGTRWGHRCLLVEFHPMNTIAILRWAMGLRWIN